MNDSPAPPVAVVEVFCPSCGYDLRMLAAGTCPECGQAFDPVELRRSQIPWSYRRQIGRVRGYWRTVRLVLFHNAQFCRETSRPVSYRDARLFQLVTIAIVLASLVALAAGLYLHGEFEPIMWAVERIWPLAIAPAVVVLFLLAATGVHTYWFHPRSLPLVKRNRSVALAYYCCAPLAWTPLVLALVAALAMANDLQTSGPRNAGLNGLTVVLAVATGLVLFVQIVELWWLPVVLVRRVGAREAAGQWVLAVALPVLWLLIAALTLLLIPGIIFWLWIVVTSLAG